jgi:hypothetical protein
MLKKNNILLAAASAVLALTALLIFLILPTSQLANGIEHSAKEALWVLICSPISALISTASFIFIFLKDYNEWSNLLSKTIVNSIRYLSFALGFFNFATYLTYTIDQFSLGFVAPFSDTKYEYLAVAATVIVILNFIFAAVVSIATLRSKKLNK